MKSIAISEPVWAAIASRGKFGETEDDVLRRVFDLPPFSADGSAAALTRKSGGAPRVTRATDTLSSYTAGNELHVSFASGPSKSWKLPPKNDKATLRVVRDQAIAFAEKHSATDGQVAAVKKALTGAGYHLLK